MIRIKTRTLLASTLLAAGISMVPLSLHAAPAAPPAAESGVIRVRSVHDVDETLRRLKADISAKHIRFFSETDQSDLGKEAGVPLSRSVLIEFGNPPLGVQFLTSTPYAGLDWPVRMLVFADADGGVWIAYTDFAFIAARHHMHDRDAQLKTAAEVAGGIAAAGAN
jgi:uncharacterized protein (DUF302 family)